MKNKLGLDNHTFLQVEKKLIQTKLNLLNELFTFNTEKYDIDFLKQLNDFLFSDIYFAEDLGFRNLNEQVFELIHFHINALRNICAYDKENIEKLLYHLSEIWKIQPFKTGNTRTMIAFLIILKYAFYLNIDINIDEDLMSSDQIFSFNKIIKSLTSKRI